MAHISLPNYISISWLHILIVCIRVSNYFSFFANILMSSIYLRGLIFSCDLLNVQPPAHFLSMWLSGIIAVTNSNSESTSYRCLWAFTSVKNFPSAFNSPLQFFMASMMNFMTVGYLVHFLDSLLSIFAGLYLSLFCRQSTPWLHFSVSFWSPWGCVDQCIVDHQFNFSSCGILFFLGEINRGLLASNRSPP